MDDFFILEVRYYPTALSWQVVSCTPSKHPPKESMGVYWDIGNKVVSLPSAIPLRAGCWVNPRDALREAWGAFYRMKEQAQLEWEVFTSAHPDEGQYLTNH